jgi:hypothetical protein
MLAVIIPTVWLAAAMFVVTLCRMASRSDESSARLGDGLLAEHGSPAPLRIALLSPPQDREPARPCQARPTRRTYTHQRALHGGRQRA